MKKLLLISILIFMALPSHVTAAFQTENCVRCHREGSQESEGHVSMGELEGSVHGQDVECVDCHIDIEEEGHGSVKRPVMVDCTQCHDKENRHAAISKSGNRPQCFSCHGSHGILGVEDPGSRVYPAQLKKTCKGCHPVECGETGALAWLTSLQIKSHKKQDFSQSYRRDNCIGCHQGRAAHGEEEALNDQNCHLCHGRLAEKASLLGYIHPGADLKQQPVMFISAMLYPVVLAVLLWCGFKFHILRLFGRGKK